MRRANVSASPRADDGSKLIRQALYRILTEVICDRQLGNKTKFELGHRQDAEEPETRIRFKEGQKDTPGDTPCLTYAAFSTNAEIERRGDLWA